jgi:zinc transport system substrate-binding protein
MKNRMYIFGVFIVVMIIIVATYVLFNESKLSLQSEEKVKIVATLFPQFDFMKEVGKDKVDVKMLLPAGVESHSYEPTPIDIININAADIFVYTGKEMEPWADTIATSIDNDTKILDVSENVSLIKSEEFEEKHENESIVEDEHPENSHHHENDPHIWLDPTVACVMVDNIAKSLSDIDSANKEFYENNAEAYKTKLLELDSNIKETVLSGKRNKIVFGGAFAYAYFVERYNLDFVSAYDSCGEESEPSIARVKSVIDYTKDNDIPVVFYQDLSQGNIAKMIADETGANPLPFYSLHNISKDDIDNGVTYIDLMNKNLDNLKIALN